MQSRPSLAVLLVLMALVPHGAGLRLSRESPEIEVPKIEVAQVMPVRGPEGCSLLIPICAAGDVATRVFQEWKPKCQDGKWVCGEAPPLPPKPEPEISPCELLPPTHPSGCPMERPMCASAPPAAGGKLQEFEPTCHETKDGKKKWLCEEPTADTPGLSKQCCRAMNAKCLACAAGQTLEEYCQEKPEAAGCPGKKAEAAAGCCRGMTVKCLACAAGQTEEEYCEEDPWAAGCEENDNEADAREYVLVKQDKKCGERGKRRLTKSAENVEECAALAEGAGFDAFLLGKGARRGRCFGMKLAVTKELWGRYQNSKAVPPCPSGWKDAKATDFYVLEPKP